MQSYLKQSTASQGRVVGPFIDDTDGKTPETGLTIANTDVKLSKNGAAAVNKTSGGGTHTANGDYSLTFDATDTNTVGELRVSIKVSGALAVVAKFWVLEEAIYDALFGASAAGFDASGNVTLKSGTHTGAVIPTVSALTGHTAQTGDNFARLGAPAGASIAADIAANQADLNTIITDVGANQADLNTIITDVAANQTDLNTILADTNELQTDWVNGGRLDLLIDAIKALLDDPRGEPAQGAPPVNPDLATKIDYLYKSWRNKMSNDGATTKLYADDGTTVDHKQGTTKVGDTVIKDEWATGP